MWFKEDTVNQIDIHKAKELIDQQDVTIVDIRDDQSFLEGHIAKAVQVNDGNIDDFLKNIDKQKTIICYCYHGYSSQAAADLFKENGFKTVYSLIGGFEAWKNSYPAKFN